MAEIQGKLKKVGGIILKSVPTPGPAGKDGRDGRDAPSKDEIIDALRNDNEFLRSLLEKREWEFNVERDDNTMLIKNIIATSKFKEENE